MSRRKIIIGGLIVAVGIVGTLWATGAFWPFSPSYLRRPPLAETPPLKPYDRTSLVTVPIAVAFPAIRAALDDVLPKSFSGKRENPMAFPFSNTDVRWTIKRGDITVASREAEILLSAVLSGALRITAQEGNDGRRAGGRAGAAGIFDIDIERAVQELLTGTAEPSGEVRGTAAMSSRPLLRSNWRFDPNLSGHVTIAEGGLSIAGHAIDVAGDVKSAVDRAVAGELSGIQTRLRNDTLFERTARREWAKLCRSISLPAVAPGTPNFWLEIKPIRAFASQPKIDAASATSTIGVEAQTRIVTKESKPDCPFPLQVDIVPPVEKGSFLVAVPIEVPFTEINQILNRELRGRTFPENADAAAQITVRRVEIFPSGERLLVSLLVRAREKKTWFGFAATATVFVSVRPELDLDRQVLMLRDLDIDVQSRAAFGLFGTAARAAAPFIEKELQETAVIDLKPYLANARRGIETVIADFDRQDDTLSTNAAVTALRLIGVEFDAKTMRVIAEVEGAGKVDISRLPKQ